jgi:DNA-binding NtrC family response regulator
MNQGKASVLIFGGNRNICAFIADLMRKEGFEAMVANDGEKDLKKVQTDSLDLLQADMMAPGMDGIEVLRKRRELNSNLSIVLITAHPGSRGAIKAIKEIDHDYPSKPFDNYELARVAHRALAERGLKLKVQALSSQPKGSPSLREKMGPSDVVGRLVGQVKQVADSDFSVIMTSTRGGGMKNREPLKAD